MMSSLCLFLYLGLWGLSYYEQNDIQKQGVRKASASFTEMQLYSALMNPSKGTKQMGNVFVTLGRPKWDEIFGDIQSSTTVCIRRTFVVLFLCYSPTFIPSYCTVFRNIDMTTNLNSCIENFTWSGVWQ